MNKAVLLALSALGLSACADVRMLGSTAAEQRRTMNDMQARATMAAACDISIGAYFRELNEIERNFAAVVCGGVPEVLSAENQKFDAQGGIGLQRARSFASTAPRDEFPHGVPGSTTPIGP